MTVLPKTRRQEIEKTTVKLDNFGINQELYFKSRCPNCRVLHNTRHDSASIGTYVYCTNFSNMEKIYKLHQRGRAFIINFGIVPKSAIWGIKSKEPYTQLFW